MEGQRDGGRDRETEGQRKRNLFRFANKDLRWRKTQSCTMKQLSHSNLCKTKL